MGMAKLLTDRVAGFWSKEYDIKDFTLSSVIGDIYTFRLNANTFSLDISYDKTNKVITDYVVVSGELIYNESLLMLNLTDLISQGIMNSEVSDTVFAHVEFVNASIAKYLAIIENASELRDDLDNKNTTLLSTIGSAVDQTEIIEQITNSISSSSLDTVSANIGLIEDVFDMQSMLDYTKNILEPKLDNLSLFEDKLTLVTSEPLKQSILDAESNAGVATTKAEESSDSADASKLDRWIAEAQKKTADSYATEAEDVLVKLYTSNGDGTFSYTNSTEYSSLHWATKAQELVSNGILDDDTPSALKTYSSNKIEAELLERDAINVSQQSDINGLIASILELNTANAQGQFGGAYAIALTSVEQVLPFSVITQSTDTTAFEIGTNTGTIKEAGSYNFISTVVFEDTGANGAVGTVTFNLRDTTTNSIYYTQSTTIEISAFDRDTIPFNSLMVIPDTMTLPITIDINASCNITGYSIVGFNSLLSQAGGSVQTIDTIDSALGSLITGVLI
jgi:hypothetical protein